MQATIDFEFLNICGKSGRAIEPIIAPNASLESKIAYPEAPEPSVSLAILGIKGWDAPQNNTVKDRIIRILIFTDLYE